MKIFWISNFLKNKDVLLKEKVCSHNDTVQPIACLDRVPTTGGGCTSFILMSCGKCTKIFGFPQSNLILSTQEFKKQIQIDLMEKGWGDLDLTPAS